MPQIPVSIAEFAAKIRARRPDLVNIGDDELVQKTLDAAPELRAYVVHGPMSATLAAQAKKYPTPAERAGSAPGTAETAADMETPRSFLNSASDFVGGFIGAVNPLPALKALYEAGPMKMGKGMTRAQLEQFQKAKRAYYEGRYTEAFGYTVAGVTPLVGPGAAAVGEKIGEGRVAEGAGETAAFLAPSALRAKGSIPIKPGLPSRLNPAESAAVALADREGIPLDLATRTGGTVARNTEALIQNQPGGAGYAKAARDAQAGALARTAERLKQRVEPRLRATETAEGAGRAVQDTLRSKIQRFDAKADVAYGALRNLEAAPSNLKNVQVGTKTVQRTQFDAQGQSFVADVIEPIMKDVPLPVDVRPVKTALAPIYERVKERMPVAQQQASPGLRSIENILKADDHVPATVADANLSALKSITREAAAPELRNVSQGLAAKAIQELSTAVDDAVAIAGSDATAALQRGRRLTKAKYTSADLLADLRDEPVQVFNQLTQRKDTAIDALRAVARESPQNMPKLGKAYLEGLFEKATREGGWSKPDTLFSQWKELGPATKRVLFRNPNVIRDLDSFFLLAKRVAQNPNPSGTAYVASLLPTAGLVIASPQVGVPLVLGSAALSRILFNPKTAKMLTSSLRMKTGTPAAALAAGALLNIAGDDIERAGADQGVR